MKSKAKEELAEVFAEKAPSIDEVLRDPCYEGANSEEVIALWAECGREKVKSVPGFRYMKLSDIRKALAK